MTDSNNSPPRMRLPPEGLNAAQYAQMGKEFQRWVEHAQIKQWSVERALQTPGIGAGEAVALAREIYAFITEAAAPPPGE